MFKLVIQDDEGKTTVVPLIRDEITIGRKEGNTIRLTERNVSRKHARIVRSNGTVAIEDLGSYNGVRVNGTRISQRTPLSISDRVQIGDYLIELKAEGAEQTAAPASYEDAKTQPVERLDPNYGRGATPLPGQAVAAAAHGVPPPGMQVQQVVGPNGQNMMLAGNPESTLVSFGNNPHAAALGVADTDPKMQPARAPVVAAMAPATSGHARLVVLSSNFAGRDFELTKPQMVIGRTDDNDVVVNHRSISRNHAKVVREPETGRYTIMDLQSSNGVRVNGEEYGKVELRRGDIIDLGHVRMRFVEPGEDFLFGRDAQAIDVPTGGGKGLWIALAALLLVGGVVVAVMVMGGKDEEGDKVAEAGSNEPAATGTGGGTAAAPAAVPDGGTVMAMKAADAEVAPPSDNKKVNDLKMSMGTAIEEEKWPEVARLCKEVLALQADPECDQKIAMAKREQAAQLTYAEFTEALAKKDRPAIAKTFKEIDTDSIYKERARPAHDRVRDTYVDEVKTRAEALSRQGKCKDIDKLADASGKLWEEAGAAVRAAGARCGAVATDGGRDGGGGSKDGGGGSKDGGGGTSGGGNDGGGGSSDTSSKTAQELIDEANAAAKAGQYGKALRSAEQALAKDPSNQIAIMTAAIAACNLKQADKAKKYINKLQPSRQGMARQICLRNNVQI